MKRKQSFFLRVPVLSCAALLLTAAVSVFRAFRMVWVFYDPNLRFLGGATGLFLLAVAVLGLLLVLLALRMWKPQNETIEKTRLCRVLGGVGFVFALLFALAAAVMIYIPITILIYFHLVTLIPAASAAPGFSPMALTLRPVLVL